MRYHRRISNPEIREYAILCGVIYGYQLFNKTFYGKLIIWKSPFTEQMKEYERDNFIKSSFK